MALREGIIYLKFKKLKMGQNFLLVKSANPLGRYKKTETLKFRFPSCEVDTIINAVGEEGNFCYFKPEELVSIDKDFDPSGKTELAYDENKRKKVKEALDKIDPFPKFTIYLDVKKNMSGYKNLNALMNSIVSDMYNSFETFEPFVFCQDGFIGIDFNYGDKNDVMDCIIDKGYDVDCKDTWDRNG